MEPRTGTVNSKRLSRLRQKLNHVLHLPQPQPQPQPQEERLPQPISRTSFKYRSLDSSLRQIRVLQLEQGCDPSSTDSPLRLSVAIVEVQGPTHRLADFRSIVHGYYAISYAWGDNPGSAAILLDGCIATVPDSAEQALRGVLVGMHEARLKRSSYIWLDAICINQQDPAEKSSQVAMMGHVYSRAKGVLIWWGQPVDPLRPPLEALQDERNIFTLLQCRWFGRLWVVQELILAKALFCFHGTYYIAWNEFAEVVRSVKSRTRFDWHCPSEYNSLLLASVICDLRTSRIRPPSQLLGLNIRLAASNPHDRVFAMLGLLHHEHTINADYNRPIQGVYADAAFYAMLTDQTLEMIWHAAVTPECLHQESVTNWPSWVPRLDSLDAEQNVRCASLLGRDFCADKSALFRLERLPDSNGIKVAGIIVGKVRETFPLTSSIETARNPIDSRSPDDIFTDQASPPAPCDLDFELMETSLEAINRFLTHSKESERPAVVNPEVLADITLEANASSSLERSTLGTRPDQSNDGARPTLANLMDHCTLAHLEGGSSAMCTKGVAVGDHVCILFGLTAPVILRPKGECWQVRGVARMHGIMKGEHIEKLRSEDRLEAETKTFVILDVLRSA